MINYKGTTVLVTGAASGIGEALASELISAQQCAKVALKGLDQNLFYIPTQAHLLDDIQPRMEAIKQAMDALGVEKA